MKQPLVSIITPMYNSSKFIEACITSIKTQSYAHWELWLIDDASTDNTLQIIQKFLDSDSRIHLLKHSKNEGAAVSRNLGITHATGDFIAFLDADDLWLPKKLEIQISFLLTTNSDVCFSSYYKINETGQKQLALVNALPELSYNKLLKCNYIGNLTGMYNVKTIGKIFAPNLRKRQDWLLWLKALKVSNKNALGIKEPLALYRVRKNSISANKLQLIKHNYWVYKKGLGFSVRAALLSTGWFLIEYFFVKTKQIHNIKN